MSDAEKPIHPLPDAKIFLEGEDGIKPLQHKAEALTQFAAGFEEVPLAPTASEKLVQLGEVMKKPHWAGAHDAAHDALTGAKKLVAKGGELASHAYSVESIFNSRAPNVHTVKGVKHPVLEEALKPLTNYLEEFGAFITGWAGLSPSRMKAKEADTAITPAQHRANMPPPATEARPPLTILPMPPQEGGGHVHGPAAIIIMVHLSRPLFQKQRHPTGMCMARVATTTILHPRQHRAAVVMSTVPAAVTIMRRVHHRAAACIITAIHHARTHTRQAAAHMSHTCPRASPMRVGG
jgi:hypothetical protein